MLAYYKQTGSPTESNSLVLYTYNKNVDPTLNNPVKTVIVTGSGAQYASLCTGACFALTGDRNDRSQAFYYQGGPAKVTTISDASTTPSTTVRTIATNSSVTPIAAGSTCNARSLYAGAAVAIFSGSALGTYDVPRTGNIVLRTTNGFGTMADNMYTLALTDAKVRPPAIAATVCRMNSVGTVTTNIISDTLPYPPCPNPLTQNIGPTCENFQKGNIGEANGVGGTVIGNVYYASSLRQEMAWSTVPNPDQYLASAQRIVIHQTSAEP